MKSLSRMTSMEQIEYMAVEARKKGMKYGEYVEKYGHTVPKPKEARSYKQMRMPKTYVCENPECGKVFETIASNARFCPECRKVRALQRAKELKRRKRENANQQ